MEKMSTRQMIIVEALDLFSVKGYEGVSMRDIAAKVGIKASSLYNHFSSKADIFGSIVQEMSERYEAAIGMMRVPHGEEDEVAKTYLNITEEQFVAIARNLFLYFLKDEFASRFRRMLTIEQFRDVAGDVFRKFFIDGALDFESSLFRSLISKGGFREADPYVMAMQFYSPIFLLLSKYDSFPEKESEALDLLTRHVTQFSRIYS